MRAWLEHPVRVSGRLIWFGAEVLLGAIMFLHLCAFRRQKATLASRAQWLQLVCRRMLRLCGVKLRISGDVPTRGLLVSNHLSYLDVIVFSALTPAVFVSKRDVKSWPVVGWFANRAGTVFVDRERRTHVGQLADDIEAILNQGVLVVLFPEGTSSGGQAVLPFKSSLLEPATRQPLALTASSIRYEIPDGDASEEVCYWGDMTLVPHLINLLGKRAISASVGFTPLREGSRDRKELARQFHAEVVRLKASLVP